VIPLEGGVLEGGVLEGGTVGAGREACLQLGGIAQAPVKQQQHKKWRSSEEMGLCWVSVLCAVKVHVSVFLPISPSIVLHILS
jgi:hypothetical protein